MLTAIGSYVLMIDADGATEIKEFDKIVNIVKFYFLIYSEVE